MSISKKLDKIEHDVAVIQKQITAAHARSRQSPKLFTSPQGKQVAKLISETKRKPKNLGEFKCPTNTEM